MKFHLDGRRWRYMTAYLKRKDEYTITVGTGRLAETLGRGSRQAEVPAEFIERLWAWEDAGHPCTCNGGEDPEADCQFIPRMVRQIYDTMYYQVRSDKVA